MKKYILGLFMAFVAWVAVSAAPGDAVQPAATDAAKAAGATAPTTVPGTTTAAATTSPAGPEIPTASTTTTPAGTTTTPPPAPPKAPEKSQWLGLGIWTAVILGIFAFLWSKGYLVKIRNYFAETQEELKKCSWPSRDELKGSTVVVLVTTVLLGLFTVVVDWMLSNLMRLIT